MRQDSANPASAPVTILVPYKAPVPEWTWTGCYIGGHIGGGQVRSDLVFGSKDDVQGGIGFLGGGQAGFNYQVKQLVLGVEGELYASGLKVTSSFDEVDPPPSTFVQHAFSELRNKWDASIALRGGFTLDRALFYGKLGVTWSRFDFSSSSQCCTATSPITTDTGSATLPGLLLGAGVEYALWSGWTAKAEYNYINYGSQTISVQEFRNGVLTETISETERHNKQIVKVGLNYLFNSVGPMFTRY